MYVHIPQARDKELAIGIDNPDLATLLNQANLGNTVNLTVFYDDRHVAFQIAGAGIDDIYIGEDQCLGIGRGSGLEGKEIDEEKNGGGELHPDSQLRAGGRRVK